MGLCAAPSSESWLDATSAFLSDLQVSGYDLKHINYRFENVVKESREDAPFQRKQSLTLWYENKKIVLLEQYYGVFFDSKKQKYYLQETFKASTFSQIKMVWHSAYYEITLPNVEPNNPFASLRVLNFLELLLDNTSICFFANAPYSAWITTHQQLSSRSDLEAALSNIHQSYSPLFELLFQGEIPPDCKLFKSYGSSTEPEEILLFSRSSKDSKLEVHLQQTFSPSADRMQQTEKQSPSYKTIPYAVIEKKQINQ